MRPQLGGHIIIHHTLTQSAKTTNQLVLSLMESLAQESAAIGTRRTGGVIEPRLACGFIFEFLSGEGESLVQIAARDSTFCEPSLSDKALHIQR